jgi:hypothetical protein
MKISLTGIKVVLLLSFFTAIVHEVASLRNEAPFKELTKLSYTLRDNVRNSGEANPKYPVYIHHNKQNKRDHSIILSPSTTPFKQGTMLSEGEYKLSLVGKKNKIIIISETLTIGPTRNYFEISHKGITNVL